MATRPLRALVVLALALAATPVHAALRCRVEPFGFTMPAQTEESNRPDGVVTIEWWMIGKTNLLCGDQVIGIDVWEHAYAAFDCDGGAVAPSPFEGAVRVGVLTAAGRVVNFAGTITGTATCDEHGMATVDASLKASWRGGARLRLTQRTLIDTSTGEIVWADEVRGFLASDEFF